MPITDKRFIELNDNAIKCSLRDRTELRTQTTRNLYPILKRHIHPGAIKTEGTQIKTETSTSPFMDGKEASYNPMPNMTLQNQSINPVSATFKQIVSI